MGYAVRHDLGIRNKMIWSCCDYDAISMCLRLFCIKSLYGSLPTSTSYASARTCRALSAQCLSHTFLVKCSHQQVQLGRKHLHHLLRCENDLRHLRSHLSTLMLSWDPSHPTERRRRELGSGLTSVPLAPYQNPTIVILEHPTVAPFALRITHLCINAHNVQERVVTPLFPLPPYVTSLPLPLLPKRPINNPANTLLPA